MRHSELIAKWSQYGVLLRTLAARVRGARLCEEMVADLEQMDRDSPDECLTIAETVAETGYGAAHLRKLLREGKIVGTGRGRALRIRRRGLPKKPGVVAPEGSRLHVLGANAEQVVRDVAGTSKGMPR